MYFKVIYFQPAVIFAGWSILCWRPRILLVLLQRAQLHRQFCGELSVPLLPLRRIRNLENVAQCTEATFAHFHGLVPPPRPHALSPPLVGAGEALYFDPRVYLLASINLGRTKELPRPQLNQLK